MRSNVLSPARRVLALILWCVGAWFSVVAVAEEIAAPAPKTTRATPVAEDPALEARVLEVAQELRCLVCQNETIAGSQADLAQDLRKQIRIKLQQGQTQQEIIDFMVARYGDFVRYRPEFKMTTILLWLGPFVFLLTALAGLAYVIRQRRQTQPAPLSEAELSRARALLAAETPSDHPTLPPISS